MWSTWRQCWAGNPRDCIHRLAYLAENTPLFHHSIFLLVQSSGYHLPCSGTQTLEFSNSASSSCLCMVPLPHWPSVGDSTTMASLKSGLPFSCPLNPKCGQVLPCGSPEDQRPECHFLTGVRVMQGSKLQIKAHSSDGPSPILASSTGQFPWHAPSWLLWG